MDIGETMSGAQESILQGKIMKENQRNVINVLRIRMTHGLVKDKPIDELDMDYFHVNRMIFLHTKSKNI